MSEKQTVNLLVGIPVEMQPIKNVTNSIVDRAQLSQSNKMLAQDLKELDVVVHLLKDNQWSFDNDPDCIKRNIIMSILKDFDTP
mgnify:CR=1 FL=1|tara:strand:- start:85 stop:336 length:252 start_codon:yes stop_codon:yes gene_type:complete